LLPRQTQKKASIVDVRCRDNLNRHFIVEMQVAHRKNLRKRMLYNAAKIIANELYPSQDFDQVRVTYSLCFLEGTMYPHKEEWFHPFRISHENFDDQLLDGMEWFFVELGKWKKLDNFSITSRRDVWLLFLSHPEKLDTMLTAEYENEYKEARKALRLIDKAKYTPEQLWAMERNADELYFAWEAMKMDIDEATKAGISEGQQLLISALNDLKQGKSIIEVASLYNFEVSFLESLYNQFISK
jgi:predicted transposase/invertase (TIGR01784 family)